MPVTLCAATSFPADFIVGVISVILNVTNATVRNRLANTVIYNASLKYLRPSPLPKKTSYEPVRRTVRRQSGDSGEASEVAWRLDSLCACQNMALIRSKVYYNKCFKRFMEELQCLFCFAKIHQVPLNS